MAALSAEVLSSQCFTGQGSAFPGSHIDVGRPQVFAYFWPGILVYCPVGFSIGRFTTCQLPFEREEKGGERKEKRGGKRRRA